MKAARLSGGQDVSLGTDLSLSFCARCFPKAAGEAELPRQVRDRDRAWSRGEELFSHLAFSAFFTSLSIASARLSMSNLFIALMQTSEISFRYARLSLEKPLMT